MKRYLPLVLVCVGVVAIVVVGVVSAFWIKRGQEDFHAHEHGSDAHAVIEPILDDPFSATESIMHALLSFTPADQETPFDQYVVVRDRLTGSLLKIADHPPTDEFAAKQFPREWGEWVTSRDRVVAFVKRTATMSPIDEHEEKMVVTVHVRQVVIHEDGAQTPWREFTADVEMHHVDDKWKAAHFMVITLGAEKTSEMKK